VVSVPVTSPPWQLPVSTPPPAPPSTPVWDADAFDLERVTLFGSFPSDMARLGSTLFVVDADQIEAQGARVRALDIAGPGPVASTLYPDTAIRAEHLVDATGAPADLAQPIGFGFYVNDILLVDDRLGFALVNAGGSDSTPPLSNLVAFNPGTGEVLQTVNLAWEVTSLAPLLDSVGGTLPGNRLLQSGAEAMAYAETPAGPRLVVAMTNLLVNPPSFGGVKQRGTLQVYDVVPGAATPVRALPQAPNATLTLFTQDYNPVALHVLEVAAAPPQPPTARLLVTCGGATAFDGSFSIVATTDASIEVHDLTTLAYEGRFRLGLAGLAGTPPAVGRDGAGHLLGYYPSSVTGEVYVLRLDGLAVTPVDASKLAVLRGPGRGLPVAVERAGQPGGNLGGCALSPDGRALVVTAFGDLYAFPAPVPGTLRILALPHDVVTGSGFGSSFLPGTHTYATVQGRTLGGVLLRPDASGRPDVFVLVGGAIDPVSFLGAGPASVGTLTTFGLVR
jgi:hypothetical protein